MVSCNVISRILTVVTQTNGLLTALIATHEPPSCHLGKRREGKEMHAVVGRLLHRHGCV